MEFVMLLVTGATGRVGRELVHELDAKGAEFRVLVRDPARAAGLPERAERVVGDLGQPATLAPAFDNVDRVFLLAAVAALALTHEGHQGKEHVLTGDEAFTVAEQVQILAKALGRDIEVREVATPAEAVRFRYPDGAPSALADAIIEGLRLMRADTVGLRTDTVRQLLGRSPGTFADWCARNADAFPSPVIR
jgi:uncharacterized protein YbjT (DUF2867 family)